MAEVFEWEEITKSLPNKPFFSTREVAQILGISQVSVIHYIHQGKILATRVGWQWIIPRQELLNILQKNANLNQDL